MVTVKQTNSQTSIEEKTLTINHIGTVDPGAVPALVSDPALALGPFIYTLEEDYQKITKLYMDLFLQAKAEAQAQALVNRPE